MAKSFANSFEVINKLIEKYIKKDAYKVFLFVKKNTPVFCNTSVSYITSVILRMVIYKKK